MLQNYSLSARRAALVVLTTLLAVALSAPRQAGAQAPFTLLALEPAQAFVTLNDGAEAWGDFDRDGDLDLVMLGAETGSGAPRTLLYRNDGAGGPGVWTLTPLPGTLPNRASGDVAWGDFDRDGDLDLALSGSDGSTGRAAIYRNNDGSFADLQAGLVGLSYSSLAWGDYDNDGDLDLFITGTGASGSAAYLYRNGGGRFAPVQTGIAGVSYGATAWGDFDDDGDLDLLLSGQHRTAGGQVSSFTTIYRNDGAASQGWSFTNLYPAPNPAFPGAIDISAGWADYTADGRLDFLISGGPYPEQISRLYRNAGPAGASWSFSADSAIPGIGVAEFDWGDVDGDGDLDVAISGANGWATSFTKLYRNDGPGTSDGWTFTDLQADIKGKGNNGVEWGDVDGDGDLDLLSSGYGIYRNDTPAANTAPLAPTGLSAVPGKTSVSLSWIAGSDAQSPAPSLTYNLRVGTTPGGGQVVAPQTRTTGGRLLADYGNAQHGTGAALRQLAPGTYYWSVQTVDTAFAASPFATQASFVIPAAQRVYLPLHES